MTPEALARWDESLNAALRVAETDLWKFIRTLRRFRAWAMREGASDIAKSLLDVEQMYLMRVGAPIRVQRRVTKMMVRASPRSADALWSLAEVEVAAGRFDVARQLLRRILRRRKLDRTVRAASKKLLIRIKREEAKR